MLKLCYQYFHSCGAVIFNFKERKGIFVEYDLIDIGVFDIESSSGIRCWVPGGSFIYK